MRTQAMRGLGGPDLSMQVRTPCPDCGASVTVRVPEGLVLRRSQGPDVGQHVAGKCACGAQVRVPVQAGG